MNEPDELQLDQWLDWRNAKDCNHYTLDLPIGTEWLLEWVEEGRFVRAWKRCYYLVGDAIKWVPLAPRQFNSMEGARYAVKRYVLSQKPEFLDSNGEVIPSSDPSPLPTKPLGNKAPRLE